MTRDRKAPGGNLEPMGLEIEETASYTRARLATAGLEPSRAALGRAAARAAVASLALAEARKSVKIADRRERLLLARVQLRKSLLHLEVGLERIPA